MPEGDTLFRTATVLRDALAGREVVAARGRPGGVALGRVVGSRIDTVEARGKHLLIGFGNGMTLHTHLRMHGSWHRYRTGERWRQSRICQAPSTACGLPNAPGCRSARRCSTRRPRPASATSIAASCASSSGSTRSLRSGSSVTRRSAGSWRWRSDSSTPIA